MAHVRQQIRDAVTTLVTGLPTTGSNVFVSRVSPLVVGTDTPGLMIFTLDEPVRTIDRDGHQMRDLSVTVDACVDASSSTADDTMDTICAEVEGALGSTITISSVACELVLATTVVELQSTFQTAVAIARMNFIVTVQTDQGAPSTPV